MAGSMLPSRRLVLVVDSQVDQLQTLCRGLFQLGLHCLTARDTAEAVARLERPEGAYIDLMLTDLTAPAEPGAELIARAHAVRPALPVLVITGLTLSPEVMAIRASGVPILRKPFTPDQLGLAIEALLSAHQPKG